MVLSRETVLELRRTYLCKGKITVSKVTTKVEYEHVTQLSEGDK